MKKAARVLIGFVSLLPICLGAAAQNADEQTEARQIVKLEDFHLVSRVDYNSAWDDDGQVESASGFQVRNITFKISGTIGEYFYFYFRPRISRMISGGRLMDAIDMAFAEFRWNGIEIGAGKQMVMIGGWEYDLNPVDMKYLTEFTGNIDCYQIGASVAYSATSDKVIFQACQSPFSWAVPDINLYSYNIMWYGSHGWYDAASSINFHEIGRGDFVNYITLGNKFNLPGGVALIADFQHRMYLGSPEAFKSFTVLGEVRWDFMDHFRLTAGGSWDYNDSSDDWDWCVYQGSSLGRATLGLDYYPLRSSRDIRLHLSGNYAFGTNGNSEGYLVPGNVSVTAGLTWKVNFLNMIKR